MLGEFVASHRHELIARCKAKVKKRFTASGVPAPVDNGAAEALRTQLGTFSDEQRRLLEQTPAPPP